MTSRLPVVVVTGSECTGKSTLATDLAERFDTVVSVEFVRGYLDRKGSDLDLSDVEPIARGQVAAEDAAAAQASRVLVKDTDLISTVVYARHYYGRCPAWIARAARERMGDVYLLLHPDVPWVADGQRDRPDQRDDLHRLFREQLEAWNATLIDVRGDWGARRATAFAAVEQVLARAGAGRRPSSGPRGCPTDPESGS